jgi:ABC-type polysaccharide/polyol phosphate transport system ATPase subunit
MPAGTLRFDRVTKTFAHHAGRMLLRERIGDLIFPSRRERLEVLKEVSFELRPGESLGLVGPNGAGKSTLLNLATRLLEPDSGQVDVEGRVAALLDLSAGFHSSLTGAENLRINAALMGLSRRQTAERFEDIVEFSGVREFIHEPLRAYSSGMILRLAFAVAVSSDPDVLLIDELIAVGDQAFQDKALEKIQSFQHAGKTVLLATHASELMTTLCERALWLDHGRIMMSGASREVLAAYLGSTSTTKAVLRND